MDQEVMLENSMSREGVWTVHLVRMGAAVDLDGWLARVPAFAWGTLETRRWVEDGLGMHHLHLVGQIQDVIDLKWPDGRCEKGCFWYARGLGAREAVRQAAERFYLVVGTLSVKAVVRQLPTGCPVDGKGQALPLRVNVLGAEVAVPIETAYWAPKGYVVVMYREGWRAE